MEMNDFLVLNTYISDDKITDINFNGKELWVDHLTKGRYRIANFNEINQVERLCTIIANCSNQLFNASFCVLETETDTLRISILHPSITNQGYSLSIRKTPAIARITDKLLQKEEMVPFNVIKMLNNCVKKHLNIMIAGLPGAGKTELCKYLVKSIQDEERIITIEDTYELRVNQIYPKKDCVAIKVNDHFSYKQAIKASLRQRPDWILLSEVRGDEVISLLQLISCGTSLISTIHAKSASSIIDRIVELYPTQENTEVLKRRVMEVLDIGIYLKCEHTKKGIVRTIEEVVSFDEQNIITLYSRTQPEKINHDQFLRYSE